MNTGAPRRLQGTRPEDVGTLWTMRRRAHNARCALLTHEGDWELRVMVEGDVVLTQRCRRGAEAFRIAAVWKDRMTKRRAGSRSFPHRHRAPPADHGYIEAVGRGPGARCSDRCPCRLCDGCGIVPFSACGVTRERGKRLHRVQPIGAAPQVRRDRLGNRDPVGVAVRQDRVATLEAGVQPAREANAAR